MVLITDPRTNLCLAIFVDGRERVCAQIAAELTNYPSEIDLFLETSRDLQLVS